MLGMKVTGALLPLFPVFVFYAMFETDPGIVL
jgi:hypothetical protein